jgi:exodeoxyribonuclease VII small subunit
MASPPAGSSSAPLTDTPAVDSFSPPASFEAALEELEALIQDMESGRMSLEASVTAYRRGAQLVAFCRENLARVQQQVRVLEGDLLKPFDGQIGQGG